MTTSSGAVVAAGSNQMTVYSFSKDTANSGTSACTGGCLGTWPPLTVPAGTTPTGSSDITGKLATITRADNGALQVTFNGLPLYFFSKDKAPGDTKGLYPNWNLVATSGTIIAAPSAAASAPASAAASPAASTGATGSTVITMTTSSGTVLAGGSNQMTVYTFTKDTANSGSSACTGGCATTWPALTVPSGAKPSAGPGATGKLGTITRTDDGTIQVTYNGLPLYFFANDKAPGDTNGHYTNWNLVTP
jgi:predicted lipoprotein with Yx(FWY)xxD motif